MPGPLLVHAPEPYARKVGLRVVLVGSDGAGGEPWGARWVRELEALPGVVWLLAGDLPGGRRDHPGWLLQALRDADLVVVRLPDEGDLATTWLAVGQALGRVPLVVAGPAGPGAAATLEGWCAATGARWLREPEELPQVVSRWVRTRLGRLPPRPLPESRELEEAERDLRAAPGEESFQTYWRMLVRLGVTAAGSLAEVRPTGTQGYGASPGKLSATLQRRRLSTLAPELGEPRLVAPHGELPSEEQGEDRSMDHSVLLVRRLALAMEDLSARFEVEAQWDRGEWGEQGDTPEAIRPVLRAFSYRAEVPLIEAVADIDGWVQRESRRAVVELCMRLRPHVGA